MNHLEWVLLAEKAESLLAADIHGVFSDLREEIESRLAEADLYRELRESIARGQPKSDGQEDNDDGE